jgi:peroxiredoxin
MRRRCTDDCLPLFHSGMNGITVCVLPDATLTMQPVHANQPEYVAMKLPERLAVFRADFEAGKLALKPTADITEKMHRATQDLIDSGAATRALQAGQKAPSFSLKDTDGNVVSSAELLQKGPLVLTFYRGAWCPYCNMDLQALQAALPELRALGAQLVAISPQTAVNSRKSQRENHLEFPVLADEHGNVAEAFGVRFALPDYLIEVYRKFGNDLPTVNADPSWTLPMPARYVIDQDGTIVYAEVNPDYTTRPDPEDLLPVLEQAVKKAA